MAVDGPTTAGRDAPVDGQEDVDPKAVEVTTTAGLDEAVAGP